MKTIYVLAYMNEIFGPAFATRELAELHKSYRKDMNWQVCLINLYETEEEVKEINKF